MRKFILILSALLICFANAAFAANLDTHSKLNSLGSSWKTYQSITPKEDKNDINIVYGGQDISLKPHFSPSTFA
ncbi:MAG: hypothetical protein H0W64_05595 [Gammaproteobacteria bacterium]|nr:hypothetical protein [Gammaproteobacteria bacterium]